jgi:hypothetical protein
VEIRSICCDPKLAPIGILSAKGFSLRGFRELGWTQRLTRKQAEVLEEQVAEKLDRARAGQLKWRKDIKRFIAVEEPVFEIRWNSNFDGTEIKLRLAILENRPSRSIFLLGWYAKDPTLDSEASRSEHNKSFRKLLDDRRD